jgi:hypothetical protein
MYFHVSIRETSYGSNEPIEKILKTFVRFNDNQQQPLDTKNIKNTTNLRLWLNRISYIKEFKSPTTNTTLTSRVLKYVEMANSNPEFREMFELVISDAAETCGDRMALSVVKLDVLYQLADTKEEAKREKILINGVWTLSILEDVARQKVEQLRVSRCMVDEIEVYLAYPIRLKERLGIPIVLSDMLYYGMSHVTESDLEFAEEMVRSTVTNEELRKEFLENNSF